MAVALDTNNANNEINAEVELEHLIGMTCNSTNSLIVHPINKQHYIYSIGPTVVIANLNDEHLQSFLRGHNNTISSLTLSECGTMIASGQFGDNAIVNLWDFSKSQLLHSFNGTTQKVQELLFTPDSKFLIASDMNGLVVMWDTLTFERIFAKQMRNKVAISSMSILKVFGKQKKKSYSILISHEYALFEWVLSYSVKNMEYSLVEIKKFSYPPNRSFQRTLTHVCTASDQSLIATTTNVGEIFLFNPNHNVFVNSFQACANGANVVLFGKDNCIFVGGGDGSIKQFALHPNTHEWTIMNMIDLGGQHSSINTLQLVDGDDCNLIATSMSSNVYKIGISAQNNIIDPNTLQLVVQSPFNEIEQIIFSDKFDHIFGTLSSSSLRIWDLSNYLNITQIVFNVNQNYGNNNSNIKVKNMKLAQKLAVCAKWHSNSVIVGFGNGSIECLDVSIEKRSINRLWNIENGHRGKVNCIEVTITKKGNSFILTGGDDGLFNVWDLNTRRLIYQYHLMIECVSFIIADSSYKDYIHLCGSQSGQIATFSLRREAVIVSRRISNKNRNKYGRITCLTQLSQSNESEFQLISSTSNGYLIIWDQDLTDAQQVIDVCSDNVFDNNIETIALNNVCLKNKRYLCCGNNIGQVCVIDMNGDCNQILCSFQHTHSNAIASIKWTPDDKQIVVASYDQSISIWNFYT